MKGRNVSAKRPSPSLVISIVALFVALAGTAWAALGANTVGSRQIKNDKVKSIDLKNGAAVRGIDVADNTLTGGEIANNTLTGGEIAESTLGQVPSAASADRVGDVIVKPVNYRASPESFTTILEIGHVELWGMCEADGRLRVRFYTLTGGDLVSASTDTVNTNETANNERYASVPNFGSGGDLLPDDEDNQVGQTVYAGDDGSLLTIDWLADNPGGSMCEFVGIATGRFP